MPSRAVIFWYVMWLVITGWLVAAVFTWTARILLVIWAVTTFVIAPPKEWPAFRRFVERHLGPAAQSHFPLGIDVQEYMSGMREWVRTHPGAGARAVASVSDDTLVANPAGRPPLLVMLTPHGVWSTHVNFLLNMSGMWHRLGLPNVRPMIGTGFWYMPIAREWYSWCGCSPVASKEVRRLFRAHTDLALVPGGFEEAVLAHRGTQELYLKRELGWVKHALRGGYGIVPTYSFGETSLTRQWRGFKLARARFAGITRIPMIAPINQGIPSGKPITLVVGTPIWFPETPNPTKDELKHWQSTYLAAVQALYDRHKVRHGCADQPLVIY